MAQPNRDHIHTASQARMVELKGWLQWHVTRPNFFAESSHSLEELQQAFRIALFELERNADPVLEAEIHRAGESSYNIRLCEDDFWDGREIDMGYWSENRDRKVRRLERESCIRLLVLIRDELAWVDNETKRLSLHITNAGDAKRKEHPLRLGFDYRPMERKVRTKQDWTCAARAEDTATKQEMEGENEGRPVKKEAALPKKEEEEEDVEMMDSDKRDSIAAGSWGSMSMEHRPAEGSSK